jgi:hypothetical protein
MGTEPRRYYGPRIHQMLFSVCGLQHARETVSRLQLLRSDNRIGVSTVR